MKTTMLMIAGLAFGLARFVLVWGDGCRAQRVHRAGQCSGRASEGEPGRGPVSTPSS
jgi:hypothetical protein